jgi:hypothetical protein
MTPGPLTVSTMADSMLPGSPSTPGAGFQFMLHPPPALNLGMVPPTPSSPMPGAAPAEALRKPYHMMKLLRATMTQRSGGYLTRRLHVPQEVWSQGGVKLASLPEKGRALEILCFNLDEIRTVSRASFGLLDKGVPSDNVTRPAIAEWASKLDEFVSSCDGVVATFGKKLGVGEGVTVKKTTWSNRFTRQFDKLTSTKK